VLIFVPLAAVDYGTEDDVRAIGEELPFGHWITRTGGCQAGAPRTLWAARQTSSARHCAVLSAQADLVVRRDPCAHTARTLICPDTR
jgi:hypothetical protein